MDASSRNLPKLKKRLRLTLAILNSRKRTLAGVASHVPGVKQACLARNSQKKKHAPIGNLIKITTMMTIMEAI